MKTIERKYISLAENQERAYDMVNGLTPTVTTWTATADGNLNTGEHIYIDRDGKTAKEAYRALEMALAEQDWEIE